MCGWVVYRLANSGFTDNQKQKGVKIFSHVKKGFAEINKSNP